MTKIQRGMVLDLNLEPTKGSETGKIRPCIVVTNNVYNARVPVIQVVPITAWSEKKSRIRTNIVLNPTEQNGLNKKSVADCLQTRPVDYRSRFITIRGVIELEDILEINQALKIIFALS